MKTFDIPKDWTWIQNETICVYPKRTRDCYRTRDGFHYVDLDEHYEVIAEGEARQVRRVSYVPKMTS